MSQADKIVTSGKLPTEWKEGADEVQAVCKNNYSMVEDVPELVPAMRIQRDDEGEIITDENDQPVFVNVLDENDNPVLDQHPLLHALAHHGLHAYRYEECDDGSVVALYANTKTANLKMKAFDSIEEASQWSPRNER